MSTSAEANTNPGAHAGPTSGEGTAPPEHRLPVRVYACVLIAALVVALLLRTFVLHAYRIPSASMEDTLLIGDYLLAERITYGSSVRPPWSSQSFLRLPALRQPRRGEIVIFRSWDDPGQEFIKRCVALASDTVEVVENMLLVNNVPFDSILARDRTSPQPQCKYLSRRNPEDGLRHLAERLRNYGPHVVKQGHAFVMGDNRENSDDSRLKGDVPLSALSGRPMIIYWSLEPADSSWNPLARVRWSRLGRVIR